MKHEAGSLTRLRWGLLAVVALIAVAALALAAGGSGGGSGTSESSATGAALRADVDNLYAMLNGSVVDALRSQVADLTRRLDAAEARSAGLETRLNEAETAVAKLKEALNATTTNLEGLDARVAYLEEEAASALGATDYFGNGNFADGAVAKRAYVLLCSCEEPPRGLLSFRVSLVHWPLPR